MSNVATMLDSLWLLQGLDQQILGFNERGSKAMREAKHAETRHQKAIENAAKALQQLRAAKSKQADLEAEIRRLDARVRQLEGEAAATSIDAVTKHRAQIDELETQGIEQIELVMKLELDLQTAKQSVETELLKSRQQAEVAAQETGFVAAAIEPLARSYAEIAARISPELLASYQGANTRWPGAAMCKVQDGYCQGCRAEINQQHIVRVKSRAEIVRCPNCLRIHDVPAA